MVWGKVDRRDDRVQIIIEDAEPIEDVRLVMVEIPVQDASNIQKQQQLKEILRHQSGESHQGKVAVVAKIVAPEHSQLVRLGVQFRVEDELEAVQALKSNGFKAESKILMKAL